MKVLMHVALLLTISTSIWAGPGTSGSLRFAVPEQQATDKKLLDYFTQQFGVNEAINNILLLPWKQIDGSDGILPVLILQKPDPAVKQMLQNQQQLLGTFKERMEAIEEIDSYHQELDQAQDELQLLKQERDAIVKRLEYLKVLMDKQGKTRLDRLEKSNEKKNTHQGERAIPRKR